MSVPSPVKNIVVTNQYVDRRMQIVWDLNFDSDVPLYYNVYRSENQYTGFILVGATNDNITNSFLDILPYSIDKNYFYKVTCVNSEGESDINATQAVSDFNYLTFYQSPNNLDFRAGLIRWQTGETPTGVIDGLNNSFYVSGRIKPLSLEVYKKPLGYPGYLRLGPLDFKVLTANSFTITTNPTATLTVGEALIVNYIWF